MAKKQAVKKAATRPTTTTSRKKVAKKAVSRPYTEESLLAIIHQSRDELRQQHVLHNLAVQALQRDFPEQGANFRELPSLARASGSNLGIAGNTGAGESQCDFLRRLRDQATDPVVRRLIEERIARECP